MSRQSNRRRGAQGGKGQVPDLNDPLAALLSDDRPGFILGHYLAGDQALTVAANLVICYLEDLKRHLLILGKTGKGKTTTARILFEGLARLLPDVQIFFFDGNNDVEDGDFGLSMAKVFGSVMTGLGRSPRFFPREPFNAWPSTDWVPVRNRLKEIIPFSRGGDGTYYTSKASVILFYACQVDGRPPRSMLDLMNRIDYNRILEDFGPDALDPLRIDEDDVAQVRMRVMELYADIGSSLDEGWSYGDTDSGYFALDSMLGRESIVLVMNMLLAQLSYYIEHEKPRGRPCVIIIDEFASFGGDVALGMFIEHARKLGAIVIVMSQTVPGIGTPTERARIIDNPELVLCHTTPEWDEIQHLISLAVVPEMTLRHGNAIGEPDLRLTEQAKVTKADMLRLRRGEGWLFQDAMAMKLRMLLPRNGWLPPFELPAQQDRFAHIRRIGRGGDAVDRDRGDGVEPRPWAEDRPWAHGDVAPFRRSDFRIPLPEDLRSPSVDDEIAEDGSAAPSDDPEVT